MSVTFNCDYGAATQFVVAGGTGSITCARKALTRRRISDVGTGRYVRAYERVSASAPQITCLFVFNNVMCFVNDGKIESYRYPLACRRRRRGR